jgi:hypothetical protein
VGEQSAQEIQTKVVVEEEINLEISTFDRSPGSTSASMRLSWEVTETVNVAGVFGTHAQQTQAME